MTAPYPFPTTKLSVPHLRELLERVRNETIRHAITVVHARRPEEGDWILSNARSRLLRGTIKIVGPEPARFTDLVEQAARTGAKVVLTGEMRREEDARALRAAAAIGMHPVAVITAGTVREAKMTLAMFGPWTNYDVALLSDA
jgi:hypothetical protein